MTQLQDTTLCVRPANGRPPAFWARVGRVLFAVTGPTGFPVCELLSILTPFLTAAGEADWRITLLASAVPSHLDGFAEATELRLFPATHVISRRHPDRSVWFELEGMTALIAPASRAATLYFPSPEHPEAPRFGALVVVEILRHEQIHLVHAAAVEIDGGATLLIAPSGGGKSTLACAWAASRTARLMADDRCFLWRKGEEIVCQGICTSVGLCRASEQILSRIGHDLSRNRAPGSPQEKILYDAEAEFGPIHRLPTPVKTVVWLTPDLAPDHPTSMTTASKIHPTLLRGSLYLGEPEVMRLHLSLIADLLNRARLLAAPSRPHYPQILDLLNRTLGGELPSAPRRPKRPHPDIAAMPAAQCALQLDAVLLGARMPEPLPRYREEHWRPLLKLAEYHGLLATLGFELGRQGQLANLPEGLRHVATAAVRTSEAGRMLHTTMLRSIAGRLDHAGIRWCVMKGPAIAERFFDPPAARPYSDLDIIVPPDRRQQAAEALSPLGFEASDINHRLKNPANRGEWVLIAHEPIRYTVELHWDYITGGSLRRFVSCDLTQVIERRVLVNVEGVTFPMTSVADQLLSCCLHATYGHGLGSLRHLLDIALIWRKCSAEERRMALDQAVALGVTGAVVLSLRRAEALFPSGGKPNEKGRPSAGFRLAIARLVMPQDATIRPWTRPNRLRGRLLRVAFRQRWI